ncbi:MAG: LysR family transcriptional regulator [Deltaproteobacteria bacterium]|nr:LysR family transcriptional regulator [Deltaproteobacteria bacterium]
MEWQQILGVYHVARLGSFTRAAEATLRSQSALSQQIKALEIELDCQLFERIRKRGIKLTSPGEGFLRFAEEVLGRYDRMVEELNLQRGIQTGQLKIAAPFTTLYHLFPEILKEYTQQFPKVDLTVLDRPQENVIELVKDGEIDFGLALESLIPKYLDAIRWKEVETVLLAPANHLLAGVKEPTLSQIALYPMIWPPRTVKFAGRTKLEELFRQNGIDYHIIMESSNVELSSLYVEMGLGVSFATIVPGLPVLNDRKIKLIPMNHYFKPDHIAVVLRRDKPLAIYKSAFIAALLGESPTPKSKKDRPGAE